MRHRTALAAFLVAAATPQVAVSQQAEADPGLGTDPAGAPALVALRLTGADDVRLDGRVDEGFWSNAIAITDFTQREPVEGGAPSEETEVRVVYDEANLYIGAIFYDDPNGILAYQRERDARLFTDDSFQLILDTFLDGRTGYFFEINPAGAMGDGLLGGGGGGGGGGPGGGGGGGGFGGGGNAWDGIWEARTERRPDGWSAEIRIPFRTLNFDPSLSEWGINFQRTIRRRNEQVLWRGYRRNQGLRSPVFAGRLQGLAGLSQGLGLEAVPSTVASLKHVPCADAAGCAPGYDATTVPYDVSLDVNYSVTSSLRASASVNTDFAEVESDQRQVNLTRFPLRFPERRDFFLEGAGVFDFAPRLGAQPFYSRNIGLDQSGQQLPIQYGTRLTGQAGDYELGFYQIGTGEHTYFNTSAALDQTIGREDFTVARAKRRLFEQSSIGVLYTRRTNAEYDDGSRGRVGHTAGVDMDLQTRHFLGDQNLELNAFLLYNSDPVRQSSRGTLDSFGRLSARGARLAFPNDIWSGWMSYREFGSDYDPSLGFVNRNNYRRMDQRVSWRPRADGISWIRDFDFSVQLRNQWQLSGTGAGNLEERELQVDLFNVNFESGDGFGISATRAQEYLERRFEVSEGIPIEIGDYSWWEYRVNGRTASYRRVSLFGSITKGGFWDGDRTRMDSRITFRPSPGVNLSTNVERNSVSMPLGDFTANVYELEGQWTPSPWVAFTNQVQYDDVSELVGLFMRVRWIVRPGNDVYFVYTHNWVNYGGGILGDPWLKTLSNGGSVKLNYTYRF